MQFERNVKPLHVIGSIATPHSATNHLVLDIDERTVRWMNIKSPECVRKLHNDYLEDMWAA